MRTWPTGDLFRHGEVVLLGLLPIEQVHHLGDRARLDLHRLAVAQQLVDLLVAVVEQAAGPVGFLLQQIERAGDACRIVARPRQVRRERAFVDVAVAGAVGLVAQQR